MKDIGPVRRMPGQSGWRRITMANASLKATGKAIVAVSPTITAGIRIMIAGTTNVSITGTKITTATNSGRPICSRLLWGRGTNSPIIFLRDFNVTLLKRTGVSEVSKELDMRRRTSMVRRTGYVAALAVVFAVGMSADPGDPPSRVARLNYENGPVSFRPGSADDWTAATPNYPLTAGDHLWADQGAQAEMHIGSTAVRLNSQTALSFLNLDDRTVQLSLTQGSIHVRILNLPDDETFEVDTPNTAISLLRPGDYRINADADNAVTSVAVIGGEAELTSGSTAFPVHPRQFARITGTDSVSRDLIDMPPLDAFDRWSEDRDRREAQSQSV